MIVTLTGATFDWIHWNTSWGTVKDGGPEVDRQARALVLAAPFRKVGLGFQYKVDLTEEQIDSLWGILDSIAAFGESCDAEERGDDAYNYRAIRHDVNRIERGE